MKHIKLFEQFINEADITQPIEGTEVVVMPGRFQPFHNGHIAALKNAAKIFGKPVVAMQIVFEDLLPTPCNILILLGRVCLERRSRNEVSSIGVRHASWH